MSKIFDLIDSYIERDPAAKGRIEVFFTSPGLHAIGIYRLSNFLWSLRLQFFAKVTSYLGRLITGIEIHPAAKFGKNLFLISVTNASSIGSSSDKTEKSDLNLLPPAFIPKDNLWPAVFTFK